MNLATLWDYFARFGAVEQIQLGKNRKTQQKIGFAFVDFKDEKAVLKVLNSKHFLHGRDVGLNSQQLDVKQFKKSSDVEEERAACLSRKVHVKGLPLTCDKMMLTATMSQFGQVEKAFVMYSHKNGTSRGFGFVEFKAQASVNKATSAAEVRIQGKLIKITRACPKDLDDEPVDPRQPSSLQRVPASPIKSDPRQQQYQIKQFKEANKSNHVKHTGVSGDSSPTRVTINAKKAETCPNSEMSSALSSHSLILPPKCPLDASFNAYSALVSAYLEQRWSRGEVRFNIRKPAYC